MCIFAQPVVSVTETNIFARILPDDWQYLVYQMNFETEESNAMVLPLPVQLPAEEDSLEFISLKDHDSFFKELDNGFPVAPPPRQSRSWAANAAGAIDSKQLEVHEVGDFIGSFVPTMDDFDRLDPQFRIPRESWDELPGYGDFGFAVFQLKSRKGKPHPMAFKFRSRLAGRDPGALFFPTVHIHDGEVHQQEEFDHTLYLQSAEFDRACGEYVQRGRLKADPATGYVRSQWPAREFCNLQKCRGIVAGDQLVHRLEMRGTYRNKDVLAKLDLSNSRQGSGISALRKLPGAAGLLVGAAGLTWFFRRRDKITARVEKQKAS